MAQIPQNRQFQEAKVPSHWGTAERRYAQSVNDLFERLFYMFGRLSKDDLSKPLNKEITDATGNISTLEATAQGLQTSVTNLGNTKNRTYINAIAPSVGLIAGDLWIDSANGNLLKRYNGSAWVAVQDGAISIAQQQADKIQWLVASGTSAANMTLTSQLYSLMAANIDLSANNSIKLAVTSQSANLFPSDPSNWEQGTISEANGSLLASTTRIRSADYITLNAGTLYTVSRVKSLTGQIILRYYDSSNAYIGGSGPWVATYPYSFSLPSGATKMRVVVRTAADGTIVPTDVPDILFSIVPAGVSGGVKTSKVTIDGTGIAMTTGGVFTTTSQNFNIDAAGNVVMKGQVEAASGKIGGFDLINNSLDNKSGFKVDPVSGITLGSVRYGPTGFVHTPELYITAPNAGKYCDLSLETEADSQRRVLFRAGLSDMDTYEDVIFSLKPAGTTQSDNYIVLRRQDAGNIKSINLVQPVETYSSLYVATNCSAQSFTDRTPAYFGNALDELRWTSGSRAKGIDHSSLPKFAQKTIVGTRINEDGEKEDYQEEGRDLGAMVSVLTRAVQQLADKLDSQQRLIEDLNRRVSA